MMRERLNRLNILVLMVVVIYTICVQKVLNMRGLGHNWLMILLFLSSVGAYKMLITFAYWAIANSNLLLRIYWGRQYIAGIWTYIYTKEGAPDHSSKLYFGVWKFEQDLFCTRVTGFGLTDSFVVRSRVSSITDMYERNNAHEILNERVDFVAPQVPVFSTTKMMLGDYRRFFLLKHATTMRAHTTIYGGVLSGDVHNDVLTKHPEFQTETEAIEFLKRYVAENSERQRLSRSLHGIPSQREQKMLK